MKAHRTDLVSLTFGLIFLVIVGFWLVVRTVNVGLPAVGWFVAGGLIVLGLLGLVGSLRRGRTDDSTGAEPELQPAEPLTAADESWDIDKTSDIDRT